MKLTIASVASFLVLLSLSSVASAQAPTVTIRPAKDQIHTVKTAPGITTRIVFPQPVSEIICGDLYDPSSGRGSFVIQRGGRDVFLKPVATKGLSNMFVKTGQDDDSVYSFDLLIVAADHAYRIVNVLEAQSAPTAKAKAPIAASRITPPAIAGPGVIDGRIFTPPYGLHLGSYSVPLSEDVPEPPSLQRVLAPVAQQSSRRVAINSEPTRRVTPSYPDFAKAAGINGDVAIEIVIDEKGRVISAKPLSGPALLRQSAVNAAFAWRYNPTIVDGAPSQAVGTITFRFERFADDRNGKLKANR